MKLIEFIREFWRDNKQEYLLSCLFFSVAGLIVYQMTEKSAFKLQNYVVMLPLFFVGIYITALCFAFFIYWRKD